MDIISNEFYGDTTRWFIGVVEEVGNDEPRLGRVRVRIYGVHSGRGDIPTEDLPYAHTVIPTTEPGVSGLGRNPYLVPGATVFGIFLDGKLSQLPLVIGSIPTMQTPSINQINSQSQDELFNSVTKSSQGFDIPGVPGSGTGGRTGIKSALVEGLDSYNYDPDAPAGRNVQLSWEYLVGLNKYTPVAVAGLIGNFLAESGSGSPIDLNITAVGDVGLKSAGDLSFGIAQWYNGTDRYNNLEKFAARRGRSKEDLFTQLAFVDYELSTVPSFRGAELNNIPTPTLAAIHVRRYYEIPAWDGNKISPVDGKRMRLGEAKAINYAKMVYNHFTRKTKESAGV